MLKYLLSSLRLVVQTLAMFPWSNIRASVERSAARFQFFVSSIPKRWKRA